MKNRLWAKSIPSNIKGGCRVVLINCPTFAIYNNEGILINYVCDIPKDADISDYQRRIIRKAFNNVNDALETYNYFENYIEDNSTPIPDYIKREFPNDFQHI